MLDTSLAKYDSINGVPLTGSTGALGSDILRILLTQNAVSHTYCLKYRQIKGSKTRNEGAHGLPTCIPSGRVSFLAVDFLAAFFWDMSSRHSITYEASERI